VTEMQISMLWDCRIMLRHSIYTPEERMIAGGMCFYVPMQKWEEQRYR
jgi:hypothetical protein